MLTLILPGTDISLDVKQQVGTRTGRIDHYENVLDLLGTHARRFCHINQGSSRQTSEVFMHTSHTKVDNARLKGTSQSLRILSVEIEMRSMSLVNDQIPVRTDSFSDFLVIAQKSFKGWGCQINSMGIRVLLQACQDVIFVDR